MHTNKVDCVNSMQVKLSKLGDNLLVNKTNP